MAEPTVRRAEAGDAAVIARLCGQLGYPSTAAAVRRRLRRIGTVPTHAVYVAQLPDGRVAGWAHVFDCSTVVSDPRAEVGGLIVDEEHRRFGVGRLLMRRAEQWARRRRLRMVQLRSNVIRKGAHLFYQRLGYRLVKTQRLFRRVV